jgi:hypothetical protein
MSEPSGNPGPAVDRQGNPVIDPTKNVLELVAAAIQRQDDLREAAMALLKERINGMEKVSKAKFAKIDSEFSLVESRRVEQKVDTKVAVDAALSAAEKAVKEQTVASEKSIIKSETSAAEQSKQQNATFTASLKGVIDTVADVKDRVGKIENLRQGAGDIRDNARLNVGMVVGIAGVVMGFLSLVAVVVTIVLTASRP